MDICNIWYILYYMIIGGQQCCSEETGGGGKQSNVPGVFEEEKTIQWYQTIIKHFIYIRMGKKSNVPGGVSLYRFWVCLVFSQRFDVFIQKTLTSFCQTRWLPWEAVESFMRCARRPWSPRTTRSKIPWSQKSLKQSKWQIKAKV